MVSSDNFFLADNASGKGVINKKRKQVNKRKQEKEESDYDSSDDNNLKIEEEQDSSDDETPAQKRLRLATNYLNKIKSDVNGNFNTFVKLYLITLIEVRDANYIDAAEIDKDLIAERIQTDLVNYKNS